MPSDISEETYGKVAYSLEQSLNKEVDWSDTYHGAERATGRYIVEPDTSISPTSESRDLGVEIVSPPQSMTTALDDYRKIRSWAIVNDHYTNRSTGLHINVSLLNDTADVDWTKLVLLSGDEHVLKQFGRMSSHYAKNALDLIQQRIEINRSDQSRQVTPAIKDAMLNLVTNKMYQIAKMIADKLMHQSHISVVVKANRIEFRSPGGDWLKHEPEVIENTVLRYVVALDAAMHPEKYREEYLKKLYRLFKGGKVDEQLMIGLFKYHKGFISKDDFKQMLQRHYQTGLPKATPAAGTAPTSIDEDITKQFDLNPYRGTFGWIGPQGQVIYPRNPSERYHYELVKYFDKQTLANPDGLIKFYKQDDELLFHTFAKLAENKLKSIFSVAKDFADSFNVARFSYESHRHLIEANSLIEFRNKMREIFSAN